MIHARVHRPADRRCHPSSASSPSIKSSLDVDRPRDTPPGPATDKRTVGERSGNRLEALREAAGMALLGPGQGLQPLGDLLETLLAGGLGEARVHLGVLVG